MANGVTSQWFDIHVKHGNYLPLEKQPTLSEVQLKMQQEHEEKNKIENKLNNMTMDQLKEEEDDLDFDDDFTRQYMAKRREEMKLIATLAKYGQVLEISRTQYVKEVTEADPNDFVLLHLYQNSNQFCLLINQNLPTIAKQYAHVKFIKIVADKCIEKFPDALCPCFIIYKAGKPVANVTNVDKVLKNDVKNISVFLKDHGIGPLQK